MTCYNQSYIEGMKEYRGLLQVKKQRLCDQVLMIQKKGWLSQQELEEIRRLLESGEKCWNSREGAKPNRSWTYTTSKGRRYSTGPERRWEMWKNAKLLAL